MLLIKPIFYAFSPVYQLINIINQYIYKILHRHMASKNTHRTRKTSKKTRNKRISSSNDAVGKNDRSSKSKRVETHNISIHKVLKQVHPDMAISKRAMGLVNEVVHDLFDRVCNESKKLCQYNNKITLSARDIKTATNLVLPKEIAKIAVDEGTIAVEKYDSARKDGQVTKQ